ncbi:IPT/TIG domain-containing protein [Chloroflexota bacterium]
MKLWRILSLSLILALALSLGVAASVLALVEQLTLDELTEKADAILVVDVTDITYLDEGEGHIFTLVTLSVEQTVKGEATDEVVLKLPGGEAGGLRLTVSDVPDFQVGERAVVFLQADEDDFRLCGWYQGKYAIQDNKIVKTNQSLSDFLADVGQVRETQDTNSEVSGKQASSVFQSPFQNRVSENIEKTSQSLTAGWQTIMTEGFEGAFPAAGWTLYDYHPTWGKESYKSFEGNYSAWCAGSTYNPPSNYANNMDAWLAYGPFSLADAVEAELNFQFWCKTIGSGDKVMVVASTDNNDFYGPDVYYGDSNGWQSKSFDLTDFPGLGNLCGQSQVWIAFMFRSDASSTDEGVFVDDVVIRKYATAPPHIDSISPSSGSAGTNSQVTINGSNFGSTQGSSKVTFYRSAGYLPLEAPIVSWSNSQIVCQVPMMASSGPVTVTTAEGNSNGYNFYVTFGYSDRKWFGASPTVEFVVNENCVDTTGELLAIQAAFETWNGVPNVDFGFTYGGNTSATWFGENGQNEIMWMNSWHADLSGRLAVTSTWYIDTGEITEVDIVFNDYAFNWSTGTVPSPSQADVQNTANHELGHALGLRDLYGDADSEKTMYGFVGTGENKKRTLHDDDRAGIQWTYPGQDNNPPNTPSNPSPANHATGISTNVNLIWSGGDPDLGDTVAYDVYFGTTPAPPMISYHQPATTYDPGILSYNTKYYWKIVAIDSQGASTIGAMWDFTAAGQLINHTLQVTVSPPGSGYVTKSPNLAVYPNGTVVTLTATASSGYDFSHWSGNAGGNSTSTTVTMNANKSATANFVVENGSAPVEEPSPEEGFAAISSFLETAYGFKSGEGWTIYNALWPSQLNTLTTLYVGRGYWIYVGEACILQFGSNVYQLDAGWNLIGWLRQL